jgi:dihydroflavonol-4-reductase
VHSAAAISYRRADRGLLERTNVEGTRAVLAACRAVGVRRLCHVSSVVALGAVRDPALSIDDDAPLAGTQLDCAYARTKAEAESLVVAASDTLDVAIASPAVVFGRSAAGSNSGHFLERLARGSGVLPSPPGSLSVVGLDDTAEGIVAVLERGARGRRYLLVESAWRLHELLELACRLLGRRGPIATVPAPAWRALAALLALLDPLVDARRATPEAVRLLGLHFRFQARRAREELGWTPRPFPAVLEEVLAELGHRVDRAP